MGSYALPGPVDAAVLARGKTVGAVAGEIGEQLGLGVIAADEMVAAVLREGLSPALVVDAVDESDDPGLVVLDLLAPLADGGARVAVGALRTRVRLARAETVRVDLDRPPDRDDGALVTYVQRRLAPSGAYPDAGERRVVAGAVSEAASGLFLVAEVVARTLARSPVDTSLAGWEKRLPRTATDAFAAYLERFPDQRRVLALLHPLALARGVGLDLEPGTVWLAAAEQLRPRDLDPFTEADLRVVRRQADDYVLTTGEGETVRLYHEALAEAVRVLAARERLQRQSLDETEQAVNAEIDKAALAFVEVMVGLLPAADAAAAAYQSLSPYLLQHLPAHLADTRRLTELLQRPGLLLTVDQEPLRQAFAHAAGTLVGDDEAARVTVVHALAQPAATPAMRAAALCAALWRQQQRPLAERVANALTNDRGQVVPLPYELISGPPLQPVVATIHTHPSVSALVLAVARERTIGRARRAR